MYVHSSVLVRAAVLLRPVAFQKFLMQFSVLGVQEGGRGEGGGERGRRHVGQLREQQQQ
jgi:hypothetical protein